MLSAAPAPPLLRLLLLLGACCCAEAWVPRSVIIQGGKFVNRKTGAVEIMNGTNVIMKVTRRHLPTISWPFCVRLREIWETTEKERWVSGVGHRARPGSRR